MDIPKDYYSESSSPLSSDSSTDDRTNSPDGQGAQPPLYHLKIVSYGELLGPLPEPADNQRQLTYDLTECPNPSEDIRRHNTGLNPDVQSAVLAEHDSKVELKRMLREVKSAMDDIETLHPPDSFDDTEDEFLPIELVIGLACGSGKHRSVTFAEQMCRYFQRSRNKRPRWGITVEHRDLGVGHDREHVDGDADDGEGVYEGRYATLSVRRAAPLENNADVDTASKRRRYSDEARRNVDEKSGGASVLRAES